MNLDQVKAFGTVDHLYLVAVFKAAGFGAVFRGWLAATHSGISLVVKVNG